MRRNSVSLRTICGELMSADREGAERFKGEMIPIILHDYTNQEIWSFDETRFFWRMLPSKSYGVRGKTRHGLKKLKKLLQ